MTGGSCSHKWLTKITSAFGISHADACLTCDGIEGGFGYDSTDMAALRYRLKTLKCDWIIGITDAGQVHNINPQLKFVGVIFAECCTLFVDSHCNRLFSWNLKGVCKEVPNFRG